MSITKKDAEIQAENIVKRVLQEKKYLSELLDGVTAKDEKVRYPNAIALEILSEKNPEIVYPDWEFFVELLDSKNSYHKSIAISTISNLTAIDREKKFEKICDHYFNLIDDKSVMVARKLAIFARRIAAAKPNLRSKITSILLNIDKTHHNTSRKDLIKGDIINFLSEFFDDAKDKNRIIEFIKKGLKSSSPSTVRNAKEFISRYKI
ncbi:MAG: hypothetical protein ACFE85_03515 [Candidatus Hodarchaeota archaeon]